MWLHNKLLLNLDKDGMSITVHFRKISNLTISLSHQTLCSDTQNIARKLVKHLSGAMFTTKCLWPFLMMNLSSFHLHMFRQPNILIWSATLESQIMFMSTIHIVLTKLWKDHRLVSNQALTTKKAEHPFS